MSEGEKCVASINVETTGWVDGGRAGWDAKFAIRLCLNCDLDGHRIFCSKKYILPHTRGTRQARGRPRGGCQNLIKNDQFLKNKCRAFEEQCHTLFAGIFVTRPFFCDFVQSLHQGLAFLAHTYSKFFTRRGKYIFFEK